MAGGWGEPGGIWQLLDLIEEHRSAFEYDWRTRFHLPLTVVGDGMGWDEAIRLSKLLLGDPSSALGAATAGWDYPLTHEALMLADLIDRFSQANFKKPKPYRRPWPVSTKRRATPTVSQAQVLEALRFAGHSKPLPAA